MFRINITRMREIEKIENYNERLYLAALEYIKGGLKVLPIRKNGKATLGTKFQEIAGYDKATTQKEIVDKWFHPKTGMFKGFNIGIGCGGNQGIFVVDVDTKKIEEKKKREFLLYPGISADSGLESMQILEEMGMSLPEGPGQVTYSGGMHYLFNWRESLVSTTSKLAPGIDTRGGSKNEISSHIVVFPSQINGAPYLWGSGGPVPNAPDWILDSLGTVWKSKKTRGNENVGDEDTEEQIGEEKIRKLLSYIDPDVLDYDGWCSVGMAINTQMPDAKGLEIWNEWSQQGRRYRVNECRARWNGFSPSGTVRIGTLFHLAKEGGYRTDEKDEIARVVEHYNKTYAVVVIGSKLKILREKDKDTQDQLESWQLHYDLMSREDFRNWTETDTLLVEKSDGKMVKVKKADIWLASENRREYPNGVGFFPDNIVPSGTFNTWRGWTVKPKENKELLNLFLWHLLWIVCAGDKEINEYVLDWLADMLQDPGKPKGTAIVMRGTEGVGKGTLYQWLAPMFGPHATHLIDDHHLTGNFNNLLADTMLLFADEITWGGNVKSAGKLKGLVTEKSIVIERKGIDSIKNKNYIRMIISSNSDWVVPAGAGARRWLVLDVDADKKGDIEYFTKLYHAMDNGGVEALAHYLMNRKITQDLHTAPHTDALVDQQVMSIMTSMNSFDGWWMEKLTDGFLDVPNESEENIEEVSADWPERVDKILLYNAYHNYCISGRIKVEPKPKVYKKLKEYGLREHRWGKRGQTRRVKYSIPELETARQIFETKTKIKIERFKDEK